MAYLLKSARVITLDPPNIETADLRIEGGQIASRAESLDPLPEDEIINAAGKLVMPGMVCAHTHLYSALARGMPAPPRTPANFKEILELIWWRLDRALDAEAIYYSALAGAMDAARAGTTCLIDHHASPSHIKGSLQIVREAIQEVGLRAVLCYEVTDRGGPRERDQGIAENEAFLSWTRNAVSPNSPSTAPSPSLFRAMVGAHASFTLSDESLRMCAELMREFDAGLHIHAAEDFCDVEDARERFGAGVVARLANLGALISKTILAHAVHLDDSDIEVARNHGAWFAHNPRSNMNNQVGYAPVSKFMPRLLMGTDGIGADMFEEARFAFFNGRDSRAGLDAGDWLRVLANNQKFASTLYGTDLNSLPPGSAADLLIVDYQPPTDLNEGNLAWHLMFGLTSACVESVMVAGRFVIRNREASFDSETYYQNARRTSEKLWARLRETR
jgi:putative selenium metabolism protein SsnA